MWGFGPDDLLSLQAMLSLRLRDAGFEPERDVAPGGLRQMTEMSGGLPRYAITLVRSAVLDAIKHSSERLEARHVEAALQEVGERLGLGLNEEQFELLRRVHQKATLPGSERATVLFATGRILAYPPAPLSHKPRWVVHPLLLPDVEQPKAGGAP